MCMNGYLWRYYIKNYNLLLKIKYFLRNLSPWSRETNTPLASYKSITSCEQRSFKLNVKNCYEESTWLLHRLHIQTWWNSLRILGSTWNYPTCHSQWAWTKAEDVNGEVGMVCRVCLRKRRTYWTQTFGEWSEKLLGSRMT